VLDSGQGLNASLKMAGGNKDRQRDVTECLLLIYSASTKK
jgi:hypothetical protein